MPSEYEKPIPDEYFTLWVLVAQTKDAILKARERDYARYGISNERRAVLWDIQNSDGHAAPVDIARNLFREIHSMTMLLRRMENDGLLTRYISDGKSKSEVKLTDEGLDVFRQSLYNETDRRVFSVLTKTERKHLESCLWKLRSKALQDLGVPKWRIKFPIRPEEEKG